MFTSQASVELRVRELESENRDLQYQLDEKRRDEQRRRDEQEERRREQRRALNPSNRLYRGEIGNFREAIEAHIQALRNERNSPYNASSDPDDVKFRAEFDGYIASAEALRKEYEDSIGAAERALFEKWAASDNDKSLGTYSSLKAVTGQCGLSGDYSPLAI